MTTVGQIVPFDIFKGKPRITKGHIDLPGRNVGITTHYRVEASSFFPTSDVEYGMYDTVLLVRKDEGWRIWHRLDVGIITIDRVVGRADDWSDWNDSDIRKLKNFNASLRQSNRSAAWYPSLAHPDDKCTKCNAKAYWTQWCYTTVSGKTSGRIVHLCKECTMNGKEEHSGRAHCKLSGQAGTDRLLYEMDGEDHYPCNSNLKIKLRINSKNLKYLDKMSTYYHRWTDLSEDQVVIILDETE